MNFMSKNILFLTKPFVIEPLGIMHLSSVLKQKGHVTEIATTNEDLELKLDRFNPDIIAYSMMTGDQEFYNNINKNLKKNYKFKAIAGGPHPTFFPEFLKDSSFDAICLGEGEEAILDLAENLKSKTILNFHFKDNEKIIKNPIRPLIKNLDTLPFPDRDLVFKYPNINQGPIKHFLASRGCPYNCSYCFNESYSKIYKDKGKRVRFRSVDNLLEEVKQVINKSPTKFIYFQDDTFILNKEWLNEFSQKYKDKINLPYHCHTRANLVNESIVKTLKESQCYSIHIAAESGNEGVRKNILNRNMSNEQIINSTHLFRQYGIKTMLQNILGLPFTNLKNDFETLELNINANPDYAWASIFQPYPKTILGEKCVKERIYTGNFSDIANNFFDSSVLNIKNKNEISNLQKLFAISVANPELYYSGVLKKMIEKPYSETKEEYTKMYKDFRKNADKCLYGIEL